MIDETSKALEAARQRYFGRFKASPPMTLKLPDAYLPAFIEAIDAAVARGRALTDHEVVGLAGMTMPDGWDEPMPPGIEPPRL